MTVDKTTSLDDAALDALFADAAAQKVPEPDDALMARIMADARDNLPSRPVAAAPVAAPARGFWSSLFGQIGGAPAAAGLVAVGVMGVMIGYADTSIVSTAGAALGLETGSYGIADLYAGYSGIAGDL